MKCPECKNVNLEYDSNTDEFICPKCGTIVENEIDNSNKNNEFFVNGEKTFYSGEKTSQDVYQSIPKEIYNSLHKITQVSIAEKPQIEKNYSDLELFIKPVIVRLLPKEFQAEFLFKLKKHYFEKDFFIRKRKNKYEYFGVAYLYLFARLHYIPITKYELASFLSFVFNSSSKSIIVNENKIKTQKEKELIKETYNELAKYITDFDNHFKIYNSLEGLSVQTSLLTYENRFLRLIYPQSTDEVYLKLAEYNNQLFMHIDKQMSNIYSPEEKAALILYKFAQTTNLSPLNWKNLCEKIIIFSLKELTELSLIY